MCVNDFDEFLKQSRMTFRDLLIEGVDSNIYMVEFKNMINKCESDFEYQTLEEHLKEEFQLYLKSLKRV